MATVFFSCRRVGICHKKCNNIEVISLLVVEDVHLHFLQNPTTMVAISLLQLPWSWDLSKLIHSFNNSEYLKSVEELLPETHTTRKYAMKMFCLVPRNVKVMITPWCYHDLKS